MAYSEDLKVKVEGLYTSPNQFSEVPVGSLARAINVVLNRKSVLQTRRGYNQYGVAVNFVAGIDTITEYQDFIILTSNDTMYLDSNNDGTVWTPYAGTFSVPDITEVGARIRYFYSNKNMYFTTFNGVQKLDYIFGTPQFAGSPPALGGTGEITGGGPGFMNDDAAVAYRIVWGYKDLNDNLIISAASERIVVINESGGTRDVELTFTVPFSSQITTNWFYQVYRSDQSPTAADIPPDNYQQVLENNPTSGELTTRQITVTDITPDDLRQAFLYSSAKLEGSAAQNLPPPFCTDACLFKNYAFYSNLKYPHTYNNTLLSVGPSLGLQIGDTVTFSNLLTSFTLTAAAADDYPNGEFALFTSGTVTQNNEFTARNLINCLNLYPLNTFLMGQYVSPFNDLAGQMQFKNRTVDQQIFQMNSSRTTCWSPNIPVSGISSSNLSKQDIFPNRVAISKLSQPEAVTGLSFFDILDPREPILRIVPNRDGIIVFKSDGIASITGDDPSNFRVTILDNTAILLAPNSVTAFDNKVYYMSRQGIASISTEGTPLIISSPIEKEINLLQSYENFAALSYGVGYESERTYKFSTVTTSGDTFCTKTYNFNTLTESWLTDDISSLCSFVKTQNNKLYYGKSLTSLGSWVFQERKNGDNSDYADEEYTVTIISSDGLEIVLDSLDNVTEKMTIVQGLVQSIILSIDQDTNTITVKDLDLWVPGDATVIKPIHVEIKTNPIFGPSPGIQKQCVDVSYFFEEPNFDEIITSFTSDYAGNGGNVILIPDNEFGWGELEWGFGAWGGELNQSQRLRTFVTKAQQRCNWLAITLETEQCFVSFAFEGFSLLFKVQGWRQKQ